LTDGTRGVVGFFGFEHDRKLALKVLAYSAKKNDIHGIFSGLVLMTYHGAVLLLSGYQADEKNILEEYRSIVDRFVVFVSFIPLYQSHYRVDKKYPTGALWILNKVCRNMPLARSLALTSAGQNSSYGLRSRRGNHGASRWPSP